MAMIFNMIITLYVIPCKLSCDFSKLTDTSVMTFLHVNKYLYIRYPRGYRGYNKRVLIKYSHNNNFSIFCFVSLEAGTADLKIV